MRKGMIERCAGCGFPKITGTCPTCDPQMADFEKRTEAAREVVDLGGADPGRYEEVCGEEDEGMGRYLVVEWAGESLAYDAYTFDTLEMVKQEIDRGGNSGDSDVTGFSVHDLDDEGKEVGKVHTLTSFWFEVPK